MIIDLFGGVFIGVIFILFILLLVLVIGKIQQKYKLSAKIRGIIMCISLAIVIISPFVAPIKVENQEQFKAMTFGLPCGFVQQYTSNALPNRSFPFYTTLANPWGHSITSNLNIRADQFIYSVMSIYVVIYLGCYAIFRNRRNRAQVASSNK